MSVFDADPTPMASVDAEFFENGEGKIAVSAFYLTINPDNDRVRGGKNESVRKLTSENETESV